MTKIKTVQVNTNTKKKKKKDNGSSFYISTNENYNTSFTIYNKDLNEAKTIDDIEYISIEDISYN